MKYPYFIGLFLLATISIAQAKESEEEKLFKKLEEDFQSPSTFSLKTGKYDTTVNCIMRYIKNDESSYDSTDVIQTSFFISHDAYQHKVYFSWHDFSPHVTLTRNNQYEFFKENQLYKIQARIYYGKWILRQEDKESSEITYCYTLTFLKDGN